MMMMMMMMMRLIQVWKYFALLLITANFVISARETKNSKLSKELCLSKYGNVTAIESSKMWDRGMPFLLLSFPGSGNTWVRLLTEYATGLYSSTIYRDHDKELLKVFHAEEKCGLLQIIIKAHPEDLVYRGFMDKFGNEIKGPKALRSINKNSRRKCDRSFVRHWDKVILLTRDPYHAIFSDYQRMVTQSHTGESMLFQADDADPSEELSAAKKFWLKTALAKAESFKTKMDEIIYPILQHRHPNPNSLLPFMHPLYNVSMGVFRYEDLTNPMLREQTLSRLVQMLNVTTYSDSVRMRCAFVLANDPRIRRGYSSKKPASVVKSSNRSTTHVMMNRAYLGVQSNFSLILWNQLESFSNNFSYPMFKSPVIL